jgi:hypothetical protein
VKARGELTALDERVRLAAKALSELAGPASAVGPELVQAIHATRDDVERWLAGESLAVALAGEPAAKRALMNAIVGARAFDPSARPGADATVTLRPAPAFDYSARMRDGSAVEFALRMPARGGSFTKAQQRAVADLEAAQAAEKEQSQRLADARRQADEASVASTPRALPPADPLASLRRFWQWLIRLVVSVFAPRRRSPAVLPTPGWSPEDADHVRKLAIKSLEQGLSEARGRLQQATARLEALRVERPKYDQERAEAFVQDVRALTDQGGRGRDVVTLSVACPTAHLPGDVALIDAGRLPPSADAVIYVATGNEDPTPEHLAELADAQRPARVQVVHKLGELAGAIDRIRSERPFVAATRSAAALRACILRVAEESARAEVECKRRIAALEGQRIPDPTEFRARQIQRVSRAVEDGARDVHTATVEHWRAAVARTKQEWHAEVKACSTRQQMEAFVKTINRTARAHLQSMVDDVGQQAVLELQRVSESIQTWLLEEIRARYHVARRIEEGDAPAAVIGEAIALEPVQRGPLESALDKFESRRVNMGLGGVAAGAVVGTLIVPGIGTAVGAFLGVFAGLLKGLDSLKQECVARLDTCLDEVQRSVAAQIAGRQASFADDLRASLDVALDAALERLNASISRVMSLESRVLETERKKREDLARLRSTLEENVMRIAAPLSAQGAS